MSSSGKTDRKQERGQSADTAASEESGVKGPGRYIHYTDSGDFFQENCYEETEEMLYWDYHLQKRRLHTMNIAKTIYSCKHTEYDVVYTPISYTPIGKAETLRCRL